MARRKQSKPQQEEQRPRVECFLLCDFARVENDKLYIIGGGWDRIMPTVLPSQHEAYLAIKLVLSGEQALESFRLVVRVVDEAGEPVGDPLADGTVRAQLTQIGEQHRGDRLPAAPIFLALGMQIVITEPGVFRAQLKVNDESLAEARFTIEPGLVVVSPDTAPDSATNSPDDKSQTVLVREGKD